MLYSVHRSGKAGRTVEEEEEDDDGYDSLWSNSEDERTRERETPDSEETPSEDDWSEDDEVREYSQHRESILSDLWGKGAVENSPQRVAAGVTTVNISTVKSEIEFLNKTFETWSIGNIAQYETKIQQESTSVASRLAQATSREEEERRTMHDEMSRLSVRRKARINELKVAKARIEAEIAERMRRELEEQRRLEEERRRAKEEQQRKAEALRKAQEEARALEERKAYQRKKEEELKERELKERERKTKEEQRLALEKMEAEKARKSEFTDWKTVEEEFLMHKAKIADIKELIVVPVSKTPELKKYCFEAKRKLKPKVGQLTSSKSQLNNIKTEVLAMLDETRRFNETAYLWLLNFLSKSIVSQAETETTVSVNSAVPLGLLAVLIMQENPQMKELLIARFVKKCPHVIGYSCGIDTEEGRVRMGYRRINEKWEDDAVYSERIAGMCSVWAVMTQSKFSANSNKEHPYPFSHSWTFLARQLNTSAQHIHNANYSAVGAWWDVAAEKFLTAYGRQGRKLLQAAWDDFTSMSSEHQKYPAAVRLRLLGMDWVKNGQLVVAYKPMTA
jgi:nucleoporin GLE1